MRGIEREPMRTHFLYIMCHVFDTGPVACFASAHFMSTIRVYSHDLYLTRMGMSPARIKSDDVVAC